MSRRFFGTANRSDVPVDSSHGLALWSPTRHSSSPRRNRSMNANHFDTLLRLLSASPSRRTVARTVAAFVVTGTSGQVVGPVGVAAKHKHKHKHNHKPKPRPLPPARCVPNCTGQNCSGDDGCGGSCGCDVCQECRGDQCVVKADGSDCGTCHACVDGRCLIVADTTPCNGGFCQSGSCVACGLGGQPCCSRDLCFQVECSIRGLCESCGSDAQVCCAGGVCGPELNCQPELVCA